MIMWLLVVYLLGLIYFAAHLEKVHNRSRFRLAWFWFALIPLSQFIFAMFRAGNLRSPMDLALVEVWANGLTGLLLAVSLFVLMSAVVPDEVRGNALSTPNE